MRPTQQERNEEERLLRVPVTLLREVIDLVANDEVTQITLERMPERATSGERRLKIKHVVK
jgi:hypothetical protein